MILRVCALAILLDMAELIREGVTFFTESFKGTENKEDGLAHAVHPLPTLSSDIEQLLATWLHPHPPGAPAMLQLLSSKTLSWCSPRESSTV